MAYEGFFWILNKEDAKKVRLEFEKLKERLKTEYPSWEGRIDEASSLDDKTKTFIVIEETGLSNSEKTKVYTAFTDLIVGLGVKIF